MPNGSESTKSRSPSGEADVSTGEMARCLREASHATPEEVAEALDHSVADYHRFERGCGRLPPGKLVLLARLHGISVEHLLLPSRVPLSDAEADTARLITLFKQLDAAKRRQCLAFVEHLAST